MKRFRESVFEIFSNAVIHSRSTLGIFSCGQFFPTRNRLDFSVADLGIGIRRNVLDHTGLDLPADQAIVWATSERNTTKRGPIPGGLGLKLLREFITLNDGRMQIVSDAGYRSLEKGEVQTALQSAPLPGPARKSRMSHFSFPASAVPIRLVVWSGFVSASSVALRPKKS